MSMVDDVKVFGQHITQLCKLYFDKLTVFEPMLCLTHSSFYLSQYTDLMFISLQLLTNTVK